MRELINITTYPTPHNNGNGGGGGVTYVTYSGNSGINNSSANSGRMNFNSVNGGEGQFTYLLAQEGTIIKLEGDEINYNFGFIGELESNSIKTGKIDADDANILKAYIGTLDSKKITTEYLTVTKQAHFFELIIDKVRAVGGQIILTPAQCVADVVIARDSNGNVVNLYKEDGTLVDNISTVLNSVAYFDVYFRNEDELGRGIKNEWLMHDQAFCQSFNVTEGVHHNIANKYYWRHVDAVLSDKMVNFTTKELRDIGNSLTTTNNIHISLFPTTIGGSLNGMTWQAQAQQIQGVYSTVQWTDITGTSNAINGVMKTDSTLLGIQITPTGQNSYYMTDKLQFQMYYTDNNNANYGIPEGMKVGVYFDDGTSEYFTNLAFDANGYVTLNLNPNNAIEAIVVVCTQPIQWHQCYAIRLSNSNCAEIVSPKASIPESGDNIVQLGYQGEDANSELDGYSRQSAIIIAAYMTPDTDLIAPSYAQYMGINDYDLKSHRGSYIDGNGAQFLGDITLAKYKQNGENVTLMSKFELTEQGIQTWVGQQDYANKTYVGSQISQTADSITTWVGQQDYANKTYVGSQISQTADSITTWVGQQDYASKTFVGSQISQTADSITTWVGQQDYANKTYVGSQISQTADSITTWVGQQDYANKTYVGSKISQSATSIQTWVGQQDYASKTYVGSQITQSATNISATVTSNIEGKLIETGIDIENKTINLKANTVNVTPSTGSEDEIAITVGDRNTYPHTLQTRRRISLWNANMNQYAILGAGSEGGFMKVGDYYGSQYEEIQAFIDKGKPTITLTKGSNYIKIGVDDNGAFIKSNCWRKQNGSTLSGTRTGQLTAPNDSDDHRACFYPNV